MATIDRRGVSVSATDAPVAGDPNPGLAYKAPCLVATTANIVLSGLQTIDGVELVAASRVLVWQQSDATTNGIYSASTGPWKRTSDASNNSQLANGCQVLVNFGAANASKIFTLISADPITFGGSAINFAPQLNFGVLPGISILGNSGASAALASSIIGGPDQVLRVNSAGSLLGFGAINLAASGTVGASILGIANGGTGQGTGFLQAGTGAIARTWQNKLRDAVNAADFGAKFDGVTDDTAAIAAAIAATPSGGTLGLPAGSALIAGAGAAIFTITTPINIVGIGASANGGVGSNFLLAAGVPSNRDVFHIVGVTNVALRGYSFRNFGVGIVSGTGGQNLFHFDTTAGTTTGFAEVMIDGIVAGQNVSAGGNSVFLNNGVGTNANGGTFNFTVQNCVLGGGVQFLKAGDSLRVLNSIITGPNAGVTSDQVAGAGQLLVFGCNITSTAGCVVIANGVAPIIAFNECEQSTTNTEANNAIIDLTGSVGNISNAKIFGNQIQGIVGTATPIRIANATGTVIDNNRIGTPSAYAHIVNTAAASGTTLGAGNLFTGGGANISDSGANTIYAPQSKGTPLAVLGNPSSTVTGPLTDIVATNINQVLRVDGVGGSIGFGQVQLAGGVSSGVTGLLPVANGGSGLATLTSHSVQVGAGTASPTQIPVGASNTVLLGNTAADPSFGAVPNAALVNSSLTIGTTAIALGATSATLAGLTSVSATDLFSNDASFLIRTNTTLTNSAAAQAATLTNAPAAGNPTKWFSIDDNGTTRRIPAW